jgi:RNA polymerase sigma-70 factor (subfamily 1)
MIAVALLDTNVIDFEQTTILVRRAQTGDSDASAALFERYLPFVSQIVALRVGKPLREFGDDEDIVQQSLLDVLRKLDGFEPRTEGSFRYWLAAVVENTIRDHWRRQHAQKRGEGRVKPFASYRTSVLAQSGLAGVDPSPSEVASLRETEERIERALLELDERDRRVIDMRSLCGMTYEEIARELELGHESSARSLFSRAAAKLSALLN